MHGDVLPTKRKKQDDTTLVSPITPTPTTEVPLVSLTQKEVEHMSKSEWKFQDPSTTQAVGAVSPGLSFIFGPPTSSAHSQRLFVLRDAFSESSSPTTPATASSSRSPRSAIGKILHVFQLVKEKALGSAVLYGPECLLVAAIGSIEPQPKARHRKGSRVKENVVLGLCVVRQRNNAMRAATKEVLAHRYGSTLSSRMPSAATSPTRKTSSDTAEDPAPSTLTIDTSNVELGDTVAVGCILGVELIWVHDRARRRGVAQRMLDAARHTLVTGYVFPIDHVAFSAPTQDGAQLAVSYSGRSDYLLYEVDDDPSC